ncbi:MAG: hypothetical protein KKC51_00130 [Verrucomicrobia bacterium]|nr:hypothetical protein [Verrucomicrobiota bacterium]
MNRDQGFRVVAIALLLLGIILAARAMWRTPPVAEQIRAKLEDLAQMTQLQAGKRHEEGAVAFFERMPNHSPVPLREIVGRVFPGLPSAVHSREEKEAASGWVARRAEFSLDPVALADISRLLAELQGDGTRPPWQLMDCQIKVSGQTPGYGCVTLGVQALEK